MSPTALKKSAPENVRIGEHAPLQPLSGVSLVYGSTMVNGMAHNAYVRLEEIKKDKK